MIYTVIEGPRQTVCVGLDRVCEVARLMGGSLVRRDNAWRVEGPAGDLRATVVPNAAATFDEPDTFPDGSTSRVTNRRIAHAGVAAVLRLVRPIRLTDAPASA